MKVTIRPSALKGAVTIPGSKSHTIRAVAIASLASGISTIEAPLVSADTLAAVDAYTAAGASIKRSGQSWTVTGTSGEIAPPHGVIDVKNSGTTLRIALGSFSLLRDGTATLTGDEQIKRRPADLLAKSLNDLGASIVSLPSNGCAPFRVRGRLRGGSTSIEAVTSQYLTSLLLCAPLADGDTHIDGPLLNEAPYVGITLDWLSRVGVTLDHADDLSSFDVPGGQSFAPFTRRIPADFSSATFFLAAGAIGSNEITSDGLDMSDTQGDKAVVDYIRALGASVTPAESSITVTASALSGRELDLNATPDALPMMAVLGCLASGTTMLANVPQARIKETDRIDCMAKELSKMGASVKELEDGLIIEHSPLRGADLKGHGDHRVVMALSVAATAAQGQTTISGAEAVSVTFPGFFSLLESLGADIEIED